MDPFATLGIERSFRIDLRTVEKTHRELSRALHPDRYTSAGASERREALAKAVEVNEAWRIVRDPVRRAEALFTLAGVPVGDTHEPKPQASLLMEMMEDREALADARAARDAARVKGLVEKLTRRQEAAEGRLGEGFARAKGGNDLAPLVPTLGELRYCRRFLEEASATMDELEGSAA